ncbi:dihydroneopterin aldolase [Salipiger marinus]|uniref:Dihydroneopterin aldolase n=1 Tax=Salipiger marinus TaxID=555512 RepID=A0A1G8MEF8_9RHOB|nr:dihydroneopterin aldolase [Salipiger marinus]SDI66301.1 dihydroneopterin aldolase [Salipiger marinus]
MADEIRLAFAHPAERAIATADEAPRDRISLRDHVVEVEIGAFQAERGHTQRVRFNIVVEVRSGTGPLEDDVDRILSYDKVTEAIALELAAERVNLLETLAERIAERILLEPQAMRAFVRIEKLDRGPGALGVEIVRAAPEARRAGEAADAARARPHPRVVYLSNAAIDDAALPRWIDEAKADGAPLVLCVDLPDGPRPQAGHPLAQRRVDLLAIEQNGWRLAARDPRAKVVATRTELDWAMRNGQISLWAPSKIVLDTPQGSRAHPEAPLDLAAWFAGLMEARELVVIGETLPADAPVPARAVTVGNTAR